MKTKVVVVDDSALIRSILTEIINSQPDMEVVGVAPDPLIAREVIKKTNPDVISLDIEMPRMDGLDFLDKLMRLRPTPVLMVSSLTEKGSEITIRALELGAVDFITKPKIGIQQGMMEYANLICDKLRVAAKANVKNRYIQPSSSLNNRPVVKAKSAGSLFSTSEKIIAIGASTGGTEAVRYFLMQMPPDCPGIVITQHMPVNYTKLFAERLNESCQIEVVEAKGGERVLPGYAYIAPGHSHMMIVKSGANYITHLSNAEPVNYVRPAVDVMFSSLAKYVGRNAVGVVLTGMGKDGAQGMLEMKQAGSYNFAQDEASCVVFGMPREAIVAGGVDEVLPLKELPSKVLAYFEKQGGRALRV